MATPAKDTPMTLVASAGASQTGPGEPVPVAFLGRPDLPVQ